MDGLGRTACGIREIGRPLGKSVIRRRGGSPSVAVHIVIDGAVQNHAVEIACGSYRGVRREPRPSVVREGGTYSGGIDFRHSAHMASGELDLAFRVSSRDASEIAVIGRGGHSDVGGSSSRGGVHVGFRRHVVARGGQGRRQMRSVDGHRSGNRIQLSYDVVPSGARNLVAARHRRQRPPCGRREYRYERESRRSCGETGSLLESFGKLVVHMNLLGTLRLVRLFQILHQFVFFGLRISEFRGDFVRASDDVRDGCGTGLLSGLPVFRFQN